MFAVDPRKYAPKPPPMPAWPAPRMPRLTTDREHIAQAEADARLVLDEIDAALSHPSARRVVRGEFVHGHFVPAPMTSREIARERLRCIVLQDREACPAWRWVPQPYRSKSRTAWGWKSCYGWERRR